MTSTVLDNDKKETEAREFASAVMTGTIIGRSLQDALRTLEAEDAEDIGVNIHGDSDSESEKPPVREVDPKQTVTIKMNGSCVDRILQSFGDRISESHLNPNQHGAPRVLLKGRCDSYNRYGQNWMVSMDSIKLKERPKKFLKRRRDDRPSLWDRDNDNTKRKEVVLNEKVQLLAYGDIA